MNYTSGTASVGERATPAALYPLSGQQKRNPRSASCWRASNFAHHSVKTHAEALRREAFEDMFVASRPKFVAIAYSILRNREDAEDAVQNAFLSGYRHLRSFEGRSALKTWFTRIVLNAALMIRRKRKASAIAPFPENGNSYEVSWLESIPTSQPDPETAHAERETLGFINGILEKMKPILRQAFTMTYFDELSGSEACALLGISSATFKARLFRARQELLHQAQRGLRAPVHRTTSSGVRILKNVNAPEVRWNLNP